MKKTLLFMGLALLLLALPFIAGAYQIKVVPPGNYWIGEIKNDSFSEGQTAFIFLPGIGERVSQDRQTAMDATQGSKAATEAAIRWMINNAGNLPAAADHFKYNLVTVAPRWEYESGEIQFAINHAKDSLKANKIILLVNSLGGFGVAREVDKSPALARQIDGIIWFVMGNGVGPKTAKNLAHLKVPNWFITAEDDRTAPASIMINLHKDIVAKGGISYLTVLKAGQYRDPHQIISLVPTAWCTDKFIGRGNMQTTSTPLGEQNVPNLVTQPTISIHEWGLRSERNKENPPG